MRTQTICIAGAVFAACQAIVPSALAQGPQKLPAVHTIQGSGFNPNPLTPEQQAKSDQAWSLGHAAAADLHLGNYAQAEAEAQEAISLASNDGVPEEVLAAALEAQGKDKEALQQYQTVVEHYDKQARNLLPYAQLLLKSGQWTQAVAVYNQALPSLPDGLGLHPERPIVQDGDLMRADSHFSPDVPEPAALATALHLARALVYNASCGWAGDAQNTEAMAEYDKALQLAPDNALANYFYSKGWHKLSLAERVKFGHAAQAKAALQKAAQSADPSVKKMAAETLKQSN